MRHEFECSDEKVVDSERGEVNKCFARLSVCSNIPSGSVGLPKKASGNVAVASALQCSRRLSNRRPSPSRLRKECTSVMSFPDVYSTEQTGHFHVSSRPIGYPTSRARHL